MKKAVMHFDGSSSPRKKDKAGCGYHLSFEDGSTVEGTFSLDPESSNNVAEYSGLIAGIKAAIDNHVTHLSIKGDSQLVVRQVLGMYKVKKDTLIPLKETVIRLLSSIPQWSIEWVPREANSKADSLSRG